MVQVLLSRYSRGINTVKFTDYFRTQIYSASGMIDGPAIDLRSYLLNHDTVYILPASLRGNPPSQTHSRGGQANAGSGKSPGLFRDWKQDDISFFNNPTGDERKRQYRDSVPTLSALTSNQKRTRMQVLKMPPSLKPGLKRSLFLTVLIMIPAWI